MTTSTVLTTSLEQIRSFDPCSTGWKDVLAANSQRDMQESFPLKNTVQSNTFSDVCWLLGKLEMPSICVEAAQMCANSVAYLINSANANASAYATAASAAAYATASSYTYASASATASAYASSYASDASSYATAAFFYASAPASATQARKEQMLKNKSFLLLAIELYEQGVLS